MIPDTQITSSGSFKDLNSPILPPTPFSTDMPVNLSHSSGVLDTGHKTVANLQLVSLDETSNQLAVLYNQILKFVQRDAKRLVDAAARVGVMRKIGATDALQETVILRGYQEKGETDVSKFDLMASVVWPEIGSAIIEDLGESIFATGKPDELYKVCVGDFHRLALFHSD